MRKICAFSPYPGASIETKSGRLKLLSAEALSDDATDAAPGSFLGRSQADGIKIACGDNSVLQITKLQPAGKNPMSGAAFLNGQNWRSGREHHRRKCHRKTIRGVDGRSKDITAPCNAC
jgi:methionyl-tRNA formyltransferase